MRAYGGMLVSTNQAGGYSVIVDAKGTSPFAGAYTRRARVSFYLAGAPDKDEDRLPDWWEEEHGTDPNKPDADQDPDGDGLPNAQEYFHKTEPLDPDTDDGGENDGSEVGRGSDPLFPNDDRGKPTVFKPWPGPGRAILRLIFPTQIMSFTVERAPTATGPFVAIATNLPPQPEWVDTTVGNDQLYCYRIVTHEVTRGDGISTTSPVQCVIPKLDPDPPHGVVAGLPPNGIAVGMLVVPEPTPRKIKLLLNASDDPSIEENPVFDGAFLFPDAFISGVTEMIISNRPDFEGATWEPYQTSKQWTLEPRADGLATVFVRFRDAAGNVSEIAHDTFLVDPNLPDSWRQLLPTIER